MKKFTLLLAFFALYLSVIGQTYVQEDFNTEIPATWTITDEGSATGDSWFSGQVVDFFGDSYSLNGTNGAVASSDVFGNGVLMIETLTTPVFDASAATGLFLDFDQYYNNIGADRAIVEVFDGTAWIEVLNQSTDSGAFNNPNQQHIDITAYKNANMQVRFIYNDGNVWAWYWMIDNVHIYNSTCNNPSVLAANVVITDVDLTWVAGGTETLWEVINQEAGGPVPTEADSGIEVTTNSHQLFGLTEGTNYEFYVRANCGADGFSIWSGPYNYRVSGPGETCSNPIQVTSPLPYVTSDNTSNYLNDYAGSPGANCSSTSGYLNGDDVVYQYSPTMDTSIDIQLSNLSDTYAGVFVYTDCADIGVSCVVGATNSFSTVDLLIDNFSVIAGTNYYIVISTWAAPQNTAYTLTITENTCIDPVSSYSVVSNCTSGTGFFVDVDLTNLGSATAITISDNQGSASQTTTATGIVTFGPYANETDVIITVTNDDDANCSLTSQILTQEFCQDFIVDCSEGPQTLNYCYSDGGATNPVIFTYTSNDGGPLNLTFNSGVIENGWDELAVVDTDGSFMVNPADLFYGNNGDLSGLTYQSTGDTISFYINSDGVFSCQTSGFVPINVTVSCATCVNPIAAYSVRQDCLNGPQFFVDVDLTDLGSASSATLTDNQGSAPQTTAATGVFTFGPFTNGTGIVVTVANDDDVNCTLTSPNLTQDQCVLNIVDCEIGPVTLNYCYGVDDTTAWLFQSSDGSPVRLTFNAGNIEGGWDFVRIYDGIDNTGTLVFESPAAFGAFDLSGIQANSISNSLYMELDTDGSVSCQTSTTYTEWNFTVTCATCINPTATYQVVDDCDNGEQFLVDVNITSLGDATSLTISNNINGDTVSVTSAGTYQVGPFPFLQNIIITMSNDQDVNCVVNSPAIQLLACPPDNDNCDGATIAAVNEDGTCDIVTPGTILAATPSGVPSGSCFGNPDDDVWFQFTALHLNQTILLQNIVGANFGLNHAVYSGSCGTLTELYCSPNNASATPDLTIGETYYIRVFSEGDFDEITTFNLCITESAGNVIVDQTTYTPEQLVQEILVNSPCAQVSNITYSTGTNFGDENGIGYFSGNGIGFPFEEGIILTTGNALEASGPNVNAMSAGTFNWPGDADLDAAVGVQSNNATIIEFDFIPLSDEISFDFLMASEEYNGSQGGTFECTYSDAFAFLLTDQNGNTTNLAVLPGTTTPILVTNIHPENPGCSAINEEYFGGYTPQNLAPISFDGRTQVFTAFSEVNIGETYHIKLVIADALDQSLDSGVYLKAGSFDIGEIDLGADITIDSGTAVCEGGQIVLETNIENVIHTWYLDGIELGETSSTLVVTEPGEYTAQIIFSAQCAPFDSIVIEFFPNPEINLDAIDFIGCSDTDVAEFTLEDNNTQILGTLSPAEYTVSYYLTEQEALDGVTAGLTSPYLNVSNPQLLWVRVTNNTTDCFETTSFNLVVEDFPITTFTSDFDYEVCPNATVPIIITATPVNYTASEVTITWYKDDVVIEGQTGLTLPVLEAGLYEIEVRFNETGCLGVAEQEIIELSSCIIPQGISPNNDGMNDRFDLSSYDVSRIEIFNRNGTLVYSKSQYTDQWYGQTNDGDELPVGTYFYSMIYQGGKEKTGWVYINR